MFPPEEGLLVARARNDRRNGRCRPCSLHTSSTSGSESLRAPFRSWCRSFERQGTSCRAVGNLSWGKGSRILLLVVRVTLFEGLHLANKKLQLSALPWSQGKLGLKLFEPFLAPAQKSLELFGVFRKNVGEIRTIHDCESPSMGLSKRTLYQTIPTNKMYTAKTKINGKLFISKEAKGRFAKISTIFNSYESKK